jgi:tetratricopeptide (TPR) repeat protein
VRRVLVMIVASGLLAGCASHRRPVAPAVREEPVDVSALIARGCFTCLEQAYTAAERLNWPQAFEAAILLAMRSKELGLPFESWLERARTLAAADPIRALYADIVDALPLDPLSGDRDVLFARAIPRPRLLASAREWRQLLPTAPGSEPFRAYVGIALTCLVDAYEDVQAAVDRTLDVFSGVPLVRYRAALCRTKGPSILADLRETDERFADADYPLATYSLGERPPDYEVALNRIVSASETFRASPAIRTVLGDVRQTREEWPQALAAYDETIVMVQTHRDALLGRTVALSRLDRHEEAIAAASRLIDLGGWYTGQAYYWRAWNQFTLSRLAEARADADKAKGQMVNAALFLLSGLIEWRSRRLEAAEREFEQSHNLDETQCDASLYIGGVRAERGVLSAALTALSDARGCFERVIAAMRQQIDGITNGRGSPEVKARLIERQQRAIRDATTRLGEATRTIALLEARLKPPG